MSLAEFALVRVSVLLVLVFGGETVNLTFSPNLNHAENPETSNEKYLETGNPPVDFTGYEQYLPAQYFTFTPSDVFVETSSVSLSLPFYPK